MRRIFVVFLSFIGLQGCLLQGTEQSSVYSSTSAGTATSSGTGSGTTLDSGQNNDGSSADPGTSTSSGTTGTTTTSGTASSAADGTPLSDNHSPCYAADGTQLCDIRNIGPNTFGDTSDAQILAARTSGSTLRVRMEAQPTDGYNLFTLRRWGPFDSPTQFNRQTDDIVNIFSACEKEVSQLTPLVGTVGSSGTPVEYFRNKALGSQGLAFPLNDGASVSGVATSGASVVNGKYYVYTYCFGKVNPANVNVLYHEPFIQVILANDFVNPAAGTLAVTATSSKTGRGDGGTSLKACNPPNGFPYHNVSVKLTLPGGVGDQTLPDLSTVPDSTIASDPPIQMYFITKKQSDTGAYFLTDSATPQPVVLSTGITSDVAQRVTLTVPEVKQRMDELRRLGTTTFATFKTIASDVNKDPDRKVTPANKQPTLDNNAIWDSQDVDYGGQKIPRGTVMTIEVEVVLKDRSLESQYATPAATNYIISSLISNVVSTTGIQVSGSNWPGQVKMRGTVDDYSHNQCGVCTSNPSSSKAACKAPY